MDRDPAFHTPTVYRIQMRGKLDESWSGWFSGMAIVSDDTTTTLTGAVADQPALRGILTKLWDLNLDLISVNRVEDLHVEEHHEP